jgi:hypothetical protein
MKNANMFALALMTLASLPLMAQQVDASAQQSAAASAGNSQVRESSNAGASANAGDGRTQMGGQADSSVAAKSGGASRGDASGSANGSASNGSASASGRGSAASGEEMRPVNTELVGKLDSKSAKAGDPVVVKTTEKTRTADGTEIPKGTKLIGHVTSVQAHGKGSADSQMGIQFDRAELKGGQSLPIHSEIRGVSPSAGALMANSMESEESLGGGVGGARMSGGGMAGGRRAGSGGVLGGAGGSVREVSQSTSRVGSGVGTKTDETAHATGHIAGNAANGVGGNLHAAGGGTANVAAHATGVPGVMLAGDASGRAAGTLSATKQNVHLDGGTQMKLGVASAR